MVAVSKRGAVGDHYRGDIDPEHRLDQCGKGDREFAFLRCDVAGACSGNIRYGIAGVDSSGGIFHAEVRLFESDGGVYA